WCRSITPIEMHEVDFYIRYLRESSLEYEFDHFYDMQLYDRIKKEFLDGGPPMYYNTWYRFYDQEFGTDSLFRLQDIRAEKEEFYLELYRKEYQRVHKEEIEESKKKYDPRPYLNYCEDDFTDKFAKANETKEFYDLYKENKLQSDNFEKDEWVYYAGDSLHEIPGYIAMEPAADWRIALLHTYERYRRETVIELLPEAFNMYRKHLGNKWNFPGRTADNENAWDGLRNVYRNHIIDGRKLNGEPPDFNF
ncbi:MAG: hypothetical protein ABI855_02570, partial [Bacteroidota bacterium]